jgi:hypothetical protein
MWLSARAGDARIEQYIRGYLRRPDDAAELAAYAQAWAEGMEPEEW